MYAAKQGKIAIHVRDDIEWVPKEWLTDEDMPWLVGLPGSGPGSDFQAHRESLERIYHPS